MHFLPGGLFMTADLIVELSEGVLTLSLNRPSKKNALSGALYDALTEALERAESDTSIRCVLIRGEGDAFTAGNDMADFAGAADPSEVLRHPQAFMKALARAGKPIVAAVHGVSVGIGTTMLLHCDVVCAALDARLMAPFVNLALVPEAGSSQLLPARIGHARAFGMFALGMGISGEQAVACGLATVAVPASEVQAKARELALLLARKAPASLQATKRLMRQDIPLEQVIDREFAEFKLRLASAEAKEAFAAFAEKRQPDFGRFTHG